jgi:hypothetical protein
MSALSMPRPFEEEALFNPAFLSLLLRESATQFSERSGGRDLPAVLAYLIAPVALHGPTRQALPTHVNAQMGEWVRAHPGVLVDLPNRARSLRPLVSIAVCFGLRHGVLGGGDGVLGAGTVKRRPRGMARSADVDNCFSRAGFLGRWFSEQTDATTTLAIWGLRA